MARLRSRKGFRGNPSTGFKIKARGIPFPPSGVAGNGMPPDPWGHPQGPTGMPGATPGSEGGLPNPSVTITPAESHLVKAGDTLWDIARIHGTTVNDIMAKNQGQNAGYANISDMGLIYPGQRIFIRSAALPAGATRSPSGDVGDQPVWPVDPGEDDPSNIPPDVGDQPVWPVDPDEPDPETAPDEGEPRPDEGLYYEVRPGDTLWDISQERGITLNELIAANPQIENPDMIFPGQIINLPRAGGNTGGPFPPDPGEDDPGNIPRWDYTVRPGDTLWEISRQTGTTVAELVRLNPQIENPNLIYPGQVINLGWEGSPGA